jgi:hypothetical protein
VEGNIFFSQKDFTRVDGLEAHLTANDFNVPASVPQVPCPKGSVAACQDLCTSPESFSHCIQSCAVVCGSDDDDGNDDDAGGLSGGAIAGIAAGSVAGAGVVVGIVYIGARKPADTDYKEAA